MAKSREPKVAEQRHNDQVKSQIAERAYYIAESEGFPTGREVAHWIAAEAQILKELAGDFTTAVAKAARKSVRATAKDGDSASQFSAINTASPNQNQARTTMKKKAKKTTAKKTTAKKTTKKKAAKKR